jgi:predicted CoA-binding protein
MPTVAIVGASSKPDRPSHKAVVGYVNRGYVVWPVNPSGEAVAGIAAFKSLKDLPAPPDIISMYVNPKIGAAMIDEIAGAKPRYLWLNPGADGEPIVSAAATKGLQIIQACNLVALSYGDPLQQAKKMKSTEKFN